MYNTLTHVYIISTHYNTKQTRLLKENRDPSNRSSEKRYLNDSTTT